MQPPWPDRIPRDASHIVPVVTQSITFCPALNDGVMVKMRFVLAAVPSVAPLVPRMTPGPVIVVPVKRFSVGMTVWIPADAVAVLQLVSASILFKEHNATAVFIDAISANVPAARLREV